MLTPHFSGLKKKTKQNRKGFPLPLPPKSPSESKPCYPSKEISCDRGSEQSYELSLSTSNQPFWMSSTQFQTGTPSTFAEQPTAHENNLSSKISTPSQLGSNSSSPISHHVLPLSSAPLYNSQLTIDHLPPAPC